MINSITAICSIMILGLGVGVIVATFHGINWALISNICDCSYLINFEITNQIETFTGFLIGTLLILLSLPSVLLIDWIARSLVKKAIGSKTTI